MLSLVLGFSIGSSGSDGFSGVVGSSTISVNLAYNIVLSVTGTVASNGVVKSSSKYQPSKVYPSISSKTRASSGIVEFAGIGVVV